MKTIENLTSSSTSTSLICLWYASGMPGIQKGKRRHARGDVTITRRQPDGHRNSVRVAELMNLLHRNATGTLLKPKLKNVPDPGEPYELSASQVKSAEILLNKALPSLQAVDMTTNTDTPEYSPQELKRQLGMLLRAMPHDEIERLLDAKPELALIEGEMS